MTTAAHAVRYWKHPAVAGVDLMRARFRHHAFARHSHETFAIGVTELGVEDLELHGSPTGVAAGGLILINPGEVHTGRAAAPGEWGYRALYPSVDVMATLHEELSTTGGLPAFRERVVYDRESTAAFVAAHRAATAGDRLASSILVHTALARFLHCYGGPPRRRRVAPAGRRTVAEATALLSEHMVAPPTLDELAELVGTGKFALLRAFHAVHGLPPYTYLTQLRVHRARALLEHDMRPAEAAVAVGFSDQAHLSRHFRRIIGMPPGRYRNQIQERPRRGRLASPQCQGDVAAVVVVGS